MTPRRGRWSGALTRKSVQVLCLLLFLALLLMARPSAHGESSELVELFFLIDPLILVSTLLSAHAVQASALWALLTIGVTLVLGRVFCGWACPLGTLHDVAGRFLRWLWPQRKRGDHWSAWHLTKYYLLVGFLVMAVFGTHWVCVFDPLVLLYRTTTTAVLPGAQWMVEASSTAVFRADPQVGSWHLTSVTEPVYAWLRDHVFVVPKQGFLGGAAILGLFLVTLGLNRYRPRFWCRFLCPLGALLGVFSWRPLLRRAVEADRCNQCDLCGMACHGAATVEPGERWKPSECLGCLNCTAACRRDELEFRWVAPWRKTPVVEGVDLSKRTACGAILGGLIGLCLLRTAPQGRGRTFHPQLIRPPGSRPEREFLARCTACGLCMKLCPTGGLQPAWSEAGLEGLWTPRLVPQVGYCDYNCNLCGHVCPTQAIELLELKTKQTTRIGLAAFDTTRCIPYAYGRDCIVCEEHCPIPDKAIYAVEVEVIQRSGENRVIKQPRVDPDKCIGCGVCENVCPYEDRPAIRVSSANEARHPENQPILPDEGPY